MEDFEREITPTLTPDDTVVFSFMGKDKEALENDPLFQLSKRIECSKALIVIGARSNYQWAHFNAVVNILEEDLPQPLNIIPNFPILGEFSAKLIFNAISTGACVQKGRVFSNRMINLGVRYCFDFGIVAPQGYNYFCLDLKIAVLV